MKANKIILATVFATGATLAAHADILINEVMQSNVYGIMDDLNDFPDSWIELYNNGETAVNLEGYRLNVKDKYKSAWQLPALVIPAQGHVLIYGDKADTFNHADFRVDSGKGGIYLYDTEGNIIDQLTLAKQPAPDIAYGRESDGADIWGYQLTPTPGKSNEGGITDTVLGPVIFSEPGGVWNERHTIELTLSLPEDAPEGTSIYYTKDGSEPTRETGKLYNGGNIKILAGTVIRAKAYCDGALSIPSNAQSYIFLERDVQIPVISIAINNEYLYDTKIGIFSEGENPPMWGDNLNANYFNDWRRPCNIEYFDGGEGSESVINQLCETRVQGGYTRRNALKSMAVYANKRFGEKRLACEFWPQDKPGITDNKSIIMRNGGNDFGGCYIRDGLMQRVIGRNTEIDWQGYRPAIICINGEYHAMLAIRERSSEDNISANYEGLEDIDMFENWWELKAGDEKAIDEFKQFISTEHSFEEWDTYLNLKSYTNLMALNYWVYNTDFPHNNIVMWRRTDGADPRWRWLVKDCDFGLGIYTQDDVNKDFASWLNRDPGSDDHTGYDLWKQLMKCPEFRDYFIDHLVVYMGDFLNAKTFLAYTDEIWEENHGEQLISNSKWAGNMWWVPDINNNLNTMRNWINKRQTNMPGIMKNGWGLGTSAKVTVNQDLTEEQLDGLNVCYDGIRLTHGTFDGYDYEGRTITLEAGDDSNITGWTIKVGGDETVTINSPKLQHTVASYAAITINAIIDEAGVADVMTDPGKSFRQQQDKIYADGDIEVYDSTGRIVTTGYRTATLPSHGIYVIKTDDGRTSKVIW